MNAFRGIVFLLFWSIASYSQGILEETVEPRPVDPISYELRTPPAVASKPDSLSNNQPKRGVTLKAQSDSLNWNEAILMELRGMRQLLGNISNNKDYIPGGRIADSAGNQLSPEAQAELLEIQRQQRYQDSLKRAQVDAEKYKDLSTMSQEELFSKAFGINPPKRKQELLVQLYVDDQYLEDVQIKYSQDFKEFFIESERLLDFLKQKMAPEIFGLISSSPAGFSSSTLAQAGLDVLLNEPEFRLDLSIPSDARSLQKHKLFERYRVPDGIEIEPAFVSAFINLQGRQEFSYYEQFYDNDSLNELANRYFGNAEPERKDWRIYTDGAVNVGGWVLEGKAKISELDHSGSYFDSLPAKTRRDEVRLVRDFTSVDTRFMLGDLSSGNAEHPAFSQLILGAKIEKDSRFFSRQRNLTASQDKIEFLLKKPASIDIYVNGALQRSMTLGSGNHELSGFRGVQGRNQVSIKVRYQDGEQEEIPFSFIQSASNITPQGSAEWEVSGGILRRSSPHGYEYKPQMDSALALGLLKYGFTFDIELQSFAQASLSQQMGGLGMIWNLDSSRSVHVRTALSMDENSAIDFWSELSYNRRFPVINLAFNGRYTGDVFTRQAFANQATVQRREWLGFGANASSRVWKGSLNFFASVSLIKYQTRTDSILINPVDYRYGGGYSLSLPWGFNLAADGRFSVVDKRRSPQLTFTASWFFNSGSNSFYALEQVSRNLAYRPSKMRLDSTVAFDGEVKDTLILTDGYYENEWTSNTSGGWSWSDGAGLVDGTSLGAGFGYQSNSNNFRINALQTMNRGLAYGNYSLTQNQTGAIQTRSHYGVFGLESSLMFADGQFALGRNVRKGFVLFNGHQDLNGIEIRANPSEQYNSEFARSGSWMSGAYTELGEYSTDYLNFKLVDPPPGTWLMEDRFYVKSGYKQGYAVKLGKPMRVLVRFRVIDETGQPVRRMVFQAFEKDKPNEILVEGFTSSTGYIQLGNLMPGKTYMVRFAETSYLNDIKVEIPDDARGIYTLPPFKTEHQKLTRNP